MLYLIGYDLNAPGQDYTAAIDAIKELSGTWWHHLDSTWIVKTEKNAVEIRDVLRPHFGSNDELLVVALGSEAAWFGFSEKGGAWLKEKL